MPPKAKINKDMIIAAGLALVRNEGAEALNVRALAARLGCSTQPVMYHYETVNALRADIYAAADAMHTQYIMRFDADAQNPLLSIGLRYIRFANEEKHLFRFLFQSDRFCSKSITELLIDESAAPMTEALCAQSGLSGAQAAEVFATLFICVHGAASLLANNSLDYEEAFFVRLLEHTLAGAIKATQRGSL